MSEFEKNTSSVEGLLEAGIAAKEQKDFSSANSFFTKAMILSQEINYSHGFLHGLMNFGTIWKLEARETGSEDFALLARSSFLEAVSYAERHTLSPEEVIHAKFLLGQSEVELENYSEAITLYKEAYAYYRQHPRSNAHTGDVKRHLGTALVKVGNVAEGITTLEEALSAVRTFDEANAVNKKNYVWETGALLALSDAYTKTNPEEAKRFVNEAFDIATKRDLVIRKQEAEKMLKMLQSL